MVRGWMVPNFRCADIRLVPSGRGGCDRRRSRPVRCAMNCFHCCRGGVLAGGQFEVDTRVGDLDDTGTPSHIGRVDPASPSSVPDSAGPRQPCLRQASKNGVNTLYGVPSPLVTRPGDTRYGEPVATSSARRRARRGPRRRAAARTGEKSCGHVHRRGADRLGQRRNSLLGSTAGDQQPAVEAVAELAQRVVEVLQPPRARRGLQPRVEDVAGEHLAVGPCRGVQQGGQVVQAQIATEPQQRRAWH